MANKKPSNELMKLDLYKLLDISEDANEKQIKKAYRMKALKCHPDKNPDNPKAAELFQQLADALKILSDVGARAAYDHLRKARKAAQERVDRLDSQRKKVKLDLEARERAAEQTEKKQAKTSLKQEIERLREEGSRILEEEQKKMREQMREERQQAEQRLRQPSEPARLRIKWKSSKGDASNGGYSESLLMKMFSKYGDVTALLLSKKKTGSAVVEFADANAARLACEAELGIPTNPLKISWLSGQPAEGRASPVGRSTSSFNPLDGTTKSTYQLRTDSLPMSSSAPSADDDFETMVLMKMKREQERKRMLAQELSNDNEDDR